jgi:hypothetical protein
VEWYWGFFSGATFILEGDMKLLFVAICSILISTMAAAQDAVNVLTAHAPHYPAIALAEGAAEDIEVIVVIDKGGGVISAKASSGINTFLKAESENSAKKWAFNKSEAIRREVTLHFNYVILHPVRNIEPDVEFSMPFTVTVRQHQRETSGPLPRR